MRASHLSMAFVSAAALLLAAPLACAQIQMGSPPTCGAVRTTNLTQNRVWVTIYDLGKTRHLDYGWVDACSYRDWRAGNYLCGSYYYVRGEVKNQAETANVYDTTVQLNPQAGSDFSNVVILHHGAGNYYWEHGGGQFDMNGKPFGCEAAAPNPNKPPVSFYFENADDKSVRVHVVSAGTGATILDYQCVPPNANRTWSITSDAQYSVIAEAANDNACKQLNNDGHAQAMTPTNGSLRIRYIHRYVFEGGV